MPVETPCNEYALMRAKWIRSRDCDAGQDAVKAKTTEYLPVLEGQNGPEDPAYVRYLKRAQFYNGTRRTVEGLTGSVFRKKPIAVLPSAMDPLLHDATLAGMSLEGLAMHTLTELVKVGRGGLLTDWSDAANRPFLRFYAAEDIINWWAPIENGRRVLRMVVLKESITEAATDEFVPTAVEQYRVYRLGSVGNGGTFATSQVYRRAKADGEFLGGPVTPLLRLSVGVPFIPFVALPGVELRDPPLTDLVDVNLSLYRTSADLEHGRHFTALPTPVVVGAPKESKLAIGSGFAWVLNDTPHSKAFMLEYTGQGLGALEKAVAEKKAEMAVLGARLLEEQRGNDTATAVGIRHRGEMSVLTRLALAASDGITQALTWAAWWQSAIDAPEVDNERVVYTLNTEYTPVSVDAGVITAMTTALEKHAISHRLFWHTLERADAVPDDWSREDEEKAIAQARDEASSRAVNDARSVLEEPDPHDPNADPDEDDDEAVPPPPPARPLLEE